MAVHRKRYQEHPELQRFDALRRFENMWHSSDVEDASVGTRDMSAAKALHDAIEEYDPSVHGPCTQEPLRRGEPSTPSGVDPAPRQPASKERETGAPATDPPAGISVGGNAPLNLVAVTAEVEVGDVLVLDPDDPDRFAPGSIAADPAAVGIVTSPLPSSAGGRQAYLALAGTIVLCKADAGFGSIRSGDLLTVSPTRGRAMRSTDPTPGTVVAKALQSLASGTGLIRVLVMSR
jgi:hypothetical protein